MDEIRITDLASAAGQLEEFDKFEFIVDVPTADASMKVSGKEIKGVMAPKKHTHAVSDVTALTGELDKKLDKKGGAITGDLSVMGDTYLRRLHLEEFLEVPEYRYNRIETVVGDKWSAPGGGIVELVSPENCTLTVKLEQGEIGILREDDLCMGVYLNAAMDASSGNTEDADDSFGNRTYAGFTTCYFRLTECLDRDSYAEWRYELREGYPYHPQAAMQIVAFGNKSDKNRQTSRYETRTYLRFLVGMDDWTIRTENIAAQFGDLTNLAKHGLDMTGYSAYLKNIYLTGFLSDRRGDSWFDSASGDMQLFNRDTGCGVSFRDGILRFGRIDPAKPDAGTDLDALMQTLTDTLETLGRINSDEYVSPVEKSFLRERLQDIQTEYAQLRDSALRNISEVRYRSVGGRQLTVGGKRRILRTLDDDWTTYETAYLIAVAAIEKYTQAEPEFIPIEADFARIEAYYEARTTLTGLLDKASKAAGSELAYLRENFQDISSEIDAGSGVVLSGFVGVKDESDRKVVAGMAGCSLTGVSEAAHGKLMFFAGADGIAHAGAAKTRIYEDGHIDVASGNFTGTITATSGKVGGFEIGTSSLTAKSGSNEMLLTSYLIRFMDSTNSLFIGADVMPSSMGGAISCPMRIEVARQSDYDYSMYGNAGLCLSVSGVKSWDDSVQTGNHALYIPHGDICGFRLRTRRVSGSQTLSALDNIILGVNSAAITLTLPASPEEGQLYFVKSVSSGNITLAVGSSAHKINDGRTNRKTAWTVSGGQILMVVWDRVNSIWHGGYTNCN